MQTEICSLNIIAIDDDSNMRKWYEHFFKKSKHNLIESIDSGDFIFNYIQKNCVDVILLDIELVEASGLQIARSLSSYNIDIIFITAYEKYAIDGYEYYPHDFIVKPIDKLRLSQSLEKLLDKRLEKNILTKVAFKVKEGIHFVDIQKIVYIEKRYRKLLIYMEKGETLQITESLKNMEMKLAKYHFYRIHRSYIVPMNRVKSFIKDDFMKSYNLSLCGCDKVLPVSKHKINDFKKKLHNTFEVYL
ncbi:LytR/AlgR family response regulator transcription factor [Bacillus sp. C30]|uniref:LytR/AlgR family response regulator transcription factor n=1 Tax=Bacillus sp. C30 TaxID=1387733 RepID=UPI00349F29CF